MSQIPPTPSQGERVPGLCQAYQPGYASHQRAYRETTREARRTMTAQYIEARTNECDRQDSTNMPPILGTPEYRGRHTDQPYVQIQVKGPSAIARSQLHGPQW